MHQIHELTQGTSEWLAYRDQHDNASDAPAALGASPYKTRNDFLLERKTGTAAEVSATVQNLFNDGHRFEGLARSLAEKIIGEDLYPVTVSSGRLSASLDGLNMMETIIWEHKSLNAEIRAAQTVEDLGLHLRIQMEQQLMVVESAEKVLFTASRWDADGNLLEDKHFWYTSDAKLRADIAAGWDQFHVDLANYEHVEVLPAAVAAPVKDLPALSIRVDGALTLNHNLVLFGEKLQSFIADINVKPDDDQAFADAEAAIKVMERAEDALGAAEASALGQISTVDDMVRTVATYKELARKTRLMLEKVVKARKETIRVEIQQAGNAKACEHIAALNTRLGKPYMPHVAADFAGVMKGKKTVTSLRDAVDTELARFKIEANAIADKIQINLSTLRELASAHTFLFADTAQIVLKANDDLTALVKLRIAEHDKAEADRAEALRAKIAEEERIKAEAAVAAEQARIQQAEVARLVEEHEAAERQRAAEAATATATTAAPEPVAEAAPAPTARVEYAPLTAERAGQPVSQQSAVTPIRQPEGLPTLRLGQINERIAPLAVSADGLRSLGFEPTRDKAAVLFHESQFPLICAALVKHIESVLLKQAA